MRSVSKGKTGNRTSYVAIVTFVVLAGLVLALARLSVMPARRSLLRPPVPRVGERLLQPRYTVQPVEPISGHAIRHSQNGLLEVFPVGDVVDYVVFSPDGRFLACLIDGGVIRVWRTADWRPIRSFHVKGVAAICFSPDSRFLAAAGESPNDDPSLKPDEGDGEMNTRLGVFLFSTRDWSVVRLLKSRGFLSDTGGGSFSVAFSADGSRLSAGQSFGRAQLWDTTSWQPLDEPIWSVSTWVGSDLVTVDDAVVKLTGPSHSRTVPLEEEYSQVDSLTPSPDGRHVLVGDIHRINDGYQAPDLIVRDLKGQDTPWILPSTMIEDCPVDVSCFSPDGQMIAIGSSDSTVWFWDTATHAPLRRLRAHENVVGAVTFNPDGRLLATGSSDGTVKIWDMKRVNTIPLELPGPGGRLETFADDCVPRILHDISRDGRVLLAGDKGGTYIWNRAHRWHVNSINFAYSAAVSPDGSTVALGRRDSGIRLWDVRSARVRRTIDPNHVFSDLAYSPDGRWLKTGPHLRLFHVRNWSEQRVPAEATSVVFSKDGSTAALRLERGRIQLRDVRSWRVMHTIQAGFQENDALLLTARGDRLAAMNDDKLLSIWDVKSGRRLCSIPASCDHESPVFSPDGRQIAVRQDGGAIQLWDCGKGRRLYELQGYGGYAESMAYSADGKRLAAGYENGSVVLWDPVRGQQLRAYSGPGIPVELVRFTSDGRLVAAGLDNSHVSVWNCRIGK